MVKIPAILKVVGEYPLECWGAKVRSMMFAGQSVINCSIFGYVLMLMIMQLVTLFVIVFSTMALSVVLKDSTMTMILSLLSLDKNSMKRISQVLQKAECIDIYGTGISYILAQSAAFKISTLGLECSAYESINSHYLAARKHKKNIAFLISLTGSNHTVICMAKYLREATETYVVGIAGPYHTELKKWCHEIVEIPNRDALLSLDVITSFSGATYILDIFFALLLSKRYEEHARSSMEMLNHLSLLWDETYHTKEKNE